MINIVNIGNVLLNAPTFTNIEGLRDKNDFESCLVFVLLYSKKTVKKPVTVFTKQR